VTAEKLALGSHHVEARNVNPTESVMPLAWLVVETNDRGLPVFARGSVQSADVPGRDVRML
jgi:hypothetical protein